MKTLPQVDFLGTKMSRLIIGGNPFSGNSHQNGDADLAMESYFTTQTIKDTLSECLDNGINTCQLRGDKHICRVLMEYRNEGHAINWIGQTCPEILPFERSVNMIKKYGANMIYHHGCVTDDLFQQGEIGELKRRLAVMRATGLPVGLCSHMPEVLRYAEEEHFDCDFYMCCVYNISVKTPVQRIARPEMENGERFDEADRARMLAFIRETEKPCLAFKILGAGRRCTSAADVDAAFEEVYGAIKPTDCVIVGMYPREQVAENCDRVRRILGEE